MAVGATLMAKLYHKPPLPSRAGACGFSTAIYIFRQMWYNSSMSKGGQTVIPTILARGGGQYDIDRSTYASQFVVLGCLWDFNVPKEITAT